MQHDLMLTYNASRAKTLWALRLPSSMPYLFTSLKVGIAAALVGAIVADCRLVRSGGWGRGF